MQVFHTAFFGLVRIRRRYIHKLCLFLDTNWKPVGRLRVTLFVANSFVPWWAFWPLEIYILTRIGERLQRSLEQTTRNYGNTTTSPFFMSVFFLSVPPHTRVDWMESAMKSLIKVIALMLPVCSIHTVLITSYRQLNTFPCFDWLPNRNNNETLYGHDLSDFGVSTVNKHRATRGINE